MKSEQMEIQEIADRSVKLYEAIEEAMMKEETPDIVYIAVLSRHLCECLVATGASRMEAMEKLNAIYEIVENQESEFMATFGSSTSLN
jgi:hypothetical protein